ncbi:hypothetical protein BEH94_05215 [Candidatus Altiarchaeales archaeon WOR_SM1_SCG]|nr:hypothetical protein BEH94_05215 [Candidatus Altiarchaeales archaeon WOR_SM1_SCG]
MSPDLNNILKQNPELKNQLIKEMETVPGLKNKLTSELVSEDEDLKRALMKKLLKDSLVEPGNGKVHDKVHDNIMTESLINEKQQKPGESLTTESEREKLYEILNKINSSKKENPEQKEEKYAMSDLFTTMVVFGEKIGQSYSLIADERKNSNRILLNINGALENLSERMNRMENKADIIIGTPRHISNSELLAKKDIEILNIIDEEGKVCADDIKEKFGYRNRNAASARLNRLEERGLLKKQYVGRNVYYTPIPSAYSQSI